jgi:hypothetical protein
MENISTSLITRCRIKTVISNQHQLAQNRHYTQDPDCECKRLIATAIIFVRGCLPSALWGDDMAMEAEVVAIGNFSSNIAAYLEYSEERYRDTREGVPVLTVLFHVYNGTNASMEMASCFGVDAWDFNTHHLNPANANVDKLRRMFDAKEVEAFLALRDAGFQFYFMPNG